MARRGAKPQATIVKRLRGNPGLRPLNDHEPQPPALDSWAAPPDLDGLPGAIEEWNRIAPMLRKCRQITAADRTVLVAICIEWARYLDATRHVRDEGLVVPKQSGKPNGFLVTNPYLVVANVALKACARLWPELGMTPSSRSRVKMEGPEAEPRDADEAAFTEFDRPPRLQ